MGLAGGGSALRPALLDLAFLASLAAKNSHQGWTEVACSLLAEPCDDLAGVVRCFDYVCDNGSCVAVP